MENGALGAVILHAPQPAEVVQRRELDLVIIHPPLVEELRVRVPVAHSRRAMNKPVQVINTFSDKYTILPC